MSVTALIVGDSLLRPLPDNPKYSCKFLPGADTLTISERILSGYFDKDLATVSLIILVVGTNDISLSLPWKVAKRVLSLGLLFQARKRGAKVIIASILPRPQDNGLYSIAIKQANQLLEPLCVSSDITFLRINNPFLSHGEPRVDYFLADGLHLSGRGAQALYRGLLSAIDRHNKLEA